MNWDLSHLSLVVQEVIQQPSTFGCQSAVLSSNGDQNSIFFLDIGPIPYHGLDLNDPRSSWCYQCVSHLMQKFLVRTNMNTILGVIIFCYKSNLWWDIYHLVKINFELGPISLVSGCPRGDTYISPCLSVTLADIFLSLY